MTIYQSIEKLQCLSYRKVIKYNSIINQNRVDGTNHAQNRIPEEMITDVPALHLTQKRYEHTVYFVSGFPQPLRSGLDLPSVCAPDKTTMSYTAFKFQTVQQMQQEVHTETAMCRHLHTLSSRPIL